MVVVVLMMTITIQDKSLIVSTRNLMKEKQRVMQKEMIINYWLKMKMMLNQTGVVLVAVKVQQRE